MIPRIHVREPPVAKLPLLRPTAPLSFLPYSTTEDLKTRPARFLKTFVNNQRREMRRGEPFAAKTKRLVADLETRQAECVRRGAIPPT